MNLFKVYPLYEITPSYGKMCYIYDKQGNKYLDLYGGHAVISIGHSHPNYVTELSNQLSKIGFYSNYIINDLQAEVAKQIINQSKCKNYNLFMCNSGAEANENALQIASFHTNRSRVIAFKNSFHGRSNAALGVTDNMKIKSKLNKLIDVTFLDFNDKQGLLNEISKNDVCAVIFESIQGVGGLDEPNTEFVINSCQNYVKIIIHALLLMKFNQDLVELEIFLHIKNMILNQILYAWLKGWEMVFL